MNPVRATTVPKIEKGSEFRTINTLRIVDMKTRKPKTEKPDQKADAPQSLPQIIWLTNYISLALPLRNNNSLLYGLIHIHG